LLDLDEFNHSSTVIRS